ncbi:uncharacterized protein LOC125069367 [Vanessa atalanta]|uniref:uncharacterized protein LOC125069367 n=1 Tax=Vanessa atalanta TaxID=42275 RepID=UPI001FCDC3D3|nr:uncharacterized protein LOC125069367 [Vanessa atalanta]
MSKKSMYKCCVVPDCKNTTIRTPNKLFFSIPVGEQTRSEWCRAMGRLQPKHRPLHPNSSRYCCEDHFDLEHDMANYLKWKLVGSSRLCLRKGVLPHKFHCQNRVTSVSGNQIEFSSPLHIKDEGSDSETACNSDPTEARDLEEAVDGDPAQEYSKLSTNKATGEEACDDRVEPREPYIVSIIYVKKTKRRRDT